MTRPSRRVLVVEDDPVINQAVSDRLVLSPKTVEAHIRAIFMKLGLAESDDVSKRVKAALMFLAE